MRHWTWRHLEPVRAERAFVSNNFRELEFSPTDVIRKVQSAGWFSFQGEEWKISKAFWGERAGGVRPTVEEGVGSVVRDGNVWVQSINVRMRSIGGWSADCRGTGCAPEWGRNGLVRSAHCVRSSPTQ